MVRAAIVLIVVLVLAIFAGAGIFLASSPGKALVLRTVSRSILNQLGVEVRASALDYRPRSLGITLYAVSVRQSTAARAFVNAERVEVDFSHAIFRGALAIRRLDVTRPDVVLDSTTQSARPAQGQSSARVPSFDIQSGRVRDLTLTSVVANGVNVAVRGLSLSFTGEGAGTARGSVIVSGGLSVRRGTSQIVFDRAKADASLTGTSLALTSMTMESPVAAIAGTASLDVSRGDLHVTYDARVALGELQKWFTEVPPLDGELDASGTIVGTLDHPVVGFDAQVKRLRWQEVTDASVSMAGHWSGPALTIDRYSASSRALRANLNGSARLVVGDNDGSSSLPISGRVQMAILNPVAPRATIATMDATGERGRWRVHSRATLDGGTSLTGDISVILDRTSLPQSTITGHVSARSARLDDALRDLRLKGLLPGHLDALPQAGGATVDATLAGTFALPRGEAKLTADSLTLSGVEHVRAETEVRFVGRAVEITRMRAEASGNRVDVRGTVTAGDGPIHLTVEAPLNRLDGLGAALPAQWRPTGSLVLSATVDGSWADPRVVARISGSDFAANGIVIGALEGDIAYPQDVHRALRYDFRFPTLSADIAGHIGFDPGWPFDGRANLRSSALTSLASLLQRTVALPDTSATITAVADIHGQLNRPLESTAVISVSAFAGQLRGRPLQLTQPGRIRLEGRRATIEEPLRITSGELSMEVARAREGETGVMVSLAGRIEDGIAFLPPEVRITPWVIEGPVRAQVSLNEDGHRFAISGEADATVDRLMRADGELASGVHLKARIRSGAIEFSAADGAVLGAAFRATARMPLAWALPAWVADAAGTPGDLSRPEAILSARSDAMLAPALQALGITNTKISGTGTFAIEAQATGPRLNDVVGTVTIEGGNVSLEELVLTQQVPTRLRFARGRLEVAALDWKGPHSFLTGSGAIGLLPGTDGELRAEGTTSLAFLRTIAPGIGGEAAFRVRVAGPPGARATSATVDLNGVDFIKADWQLALADLSGPLTLEAGVLQTGGLRGQLNGGDLTIEGAVPIDAATVAPRPLNIDARGVFVEIPQGLRSQLDTHLEWGNTATGPRLSGQIAIASDSYREPITALASAIAALTPGRASPFPLAAWIAATALDIRLNSVGPIVVDQSVLNVELVPDVRVTGTVGRPALDGHVTIQDAGRIRMGGRSYRLTDSRLEFSPAAGLLPRLNVIGETRVSSYLVTVRMGGPADQIETNFSSDPPLSERDVRSLLVTGQIADPARGTTDTNGFAVGAVSSDVLGVAGQFVGLDTVSVGNEDLDLVSSDVNPATRLTVSKRLGTKFELVLSENLEENESTWIVIYRPVSGYEFRLSSKENTREAFEFRQEITFGPGVPSRPRVRAAAVVPDKIHSVSLTGEPGFSAEQVLAATTLRQGDQFEFRAWLQDRDRIVQYYWDKGYYTARVVPMRTEAESNGKERPVDLQYRIARGRRTVLDVTGYAGSDDLLKRLRQTWSVNVVLELLHDRLTKAAREHLIDAGFLRARIDIEIDRPDTDTDRARIRIDPGPRTDVRHFGFRGNQVLTTQTLQELTTSDGFNVSAWKDPAPLIAAIRWAYAAKGYLAARVTIEPVDFAGETATLPIRIEEGRAAQVTVVQLTGVAPERRSGALEAIALAAGSPFVAGDDRSGRTRVERYYRDLGFRDVHVDSAAAATPQPTDIALTFAVHEGPRHMITSVEVEGVQSTRRSLVSKAVQLMPGQPAGAAAAAATEKRLYELGTFRRAEVRLEPMAAAAPADGIVPVKAIVSVEEARRYQLRYGLELSSEYTSALDQRTNALGLAADIRDRNFLGRGMSLGGGLRYEPDLRSARALFSTPTLRRRPIRTNVYVNARGEEQQDEQVKARDDEFDVTVEQRWRMTRAIEYSWGYSSVWRDARLAQVTGQETLDFNGILASLNGAAVIDRRDSFFDAKRGWFGSMSVQWGQREFGSDVDYLRTLVRGSYYHPLGPVVVAGNVRVGGLIPLGGPFTPTIFDLFFNAGGTESVRGYSQDALSAYSFFDAPLGGTKLLVGNAELRAPLFWRLSGVLFADAGNTFANAQPIRLDGLGVGLGFGFRINTPLAPIRIDLGFPRSFGETGVRWHFSIGQMF